MILCFHHSIHHHCIIFNPPTATPPCFTDATWDMCHTHGSNKTDCFFSVCYPLVPSRSGVYVCPPSCHLEDATRKCPVRLFPFKKKSRPLSDFCWPVRCVLQSPGGVHLPCPGPDAVLRAAKLHLEGDARLTEITGG